MRQLAEWSRSMRISGRNGFAEGAEALAESPSAFERWCDNQIMETIRPQLYNSFSHGTAGSLCARPSE